MNTIRMIAIALPMTLLLACGGGGGGGTAAAPTTTPPTITPPTITAPATPPIGTNPETPPSYFLTEITDLATARGVYGGTALDDIDYQDIILTLRTIAADAEELQMGKAFGVGLDLLDVDTNCSGKMCTVSIPDIGMLTFSISTNSIYDISLIGNGAFDDIEGYNIQHQSAMTVHEIPLVQGAGAARQSDGTMFEFQSMAGWTDGGVFGINRINVTENSNTVSYAIPFAFGDASGENPAGTDNATYNGVLISYRPKSFTPQYFQGDATITVNFTDMDVDVSFTGTTMTSGLVNPNAANSVDAVTIENIPLVDGSFTNRGVDGATQIVDGKFYGSDSNEVGGIFENDDVVGAFGATRQP